MTINRALPIMILLTLSACDGAVPPTQERQPQHPPPTLASPALPPRTSYQRPPVQALPPMAPQTDWRDVALPAGTWNWSARANGSAARYAAAGQSPIAYLQCDRAAGMVRIALPWTNDGAVRDAVITTSTSSGTVTAAPATIDGQSTLAIALPASSRLLDAMAFSRGRFRVQITGVPTTVLPAWSEVGRVIEDCRG